MASVRAGRPVPSCDSSDDADGVEIQTRQMIEWAMTGFLPTGPQALDPPEGKNKTPGVKHTEVILSADSLVLSHVGVM